VDGDLTLDGSALHGVAKLRRLIVGGVFSLRHAIVHDHMWLERSEFHGQVRGDFATFHGDTWFGESTFSAGASFVGTTFGGHAWFAGCTVRGAIDFSRALFRSSAGFRGATMPSVSLADTTFLGPARVSRKGEVWNIYAQGRTTSRSGSCTGWATHVWSRRRPRHSFRGSTQIAHSGQSDIDNAVPIDRIERLPRETARGTVPAATCRSRGSSDDQDQ
jgi:hypothetical protein